MLRLHWGVHKRGATQRDDIVLFLYPNISEREREKEKEKEREKEREKEKERERQSARERERESLYQDVLSQPCGDVSFPSVKLLRLFALVLYCL